MYILNGHISKGSQFTMSDYHHKLSGGVPEKLPEELPSVIPMGVPFPGRPSFRFLYDSLKLSLKFQVLVIADKSSTNKVTPAIIYPTRRRLCIAFRLFLQRVQGHGWLIFRSSCCVAHHPVGLSSATYPSNPISHTKAAGTGGSTPAGASSPGASVHVSSGVFNSRAV